MSEEEVVYRGSGGLEQVLAHGRGLLASDPAAAAAQAEEILRVKPGQRGALRLLGRALRKLGRDAEAEQAEMDAIRASSQVPELVRAAQALAANRLEEAEHLLRPYLAGNPDDPAALRMLAEVAARVGADADAEALLRQALDSALGYGAARLRLARMLLAANRLPECIETLDPLIEADPENMVAAGSKAAALGRIGEYSEAIALYERLLDRSPDKAGIWMSYGHLLNTVGRQADSVAAYRRAIAIDPGFGEAWWSLANLKTVRLGAADVAAMREALGGTVSDKSRLNLHFALGKALEDAGAAEESFRHYAEGNRLRRETVDYDAEAMADLVARSKRTYTAALFARPAAGCPAPDPIFVLGMPRAGSTLIEQILSSHSQVEGTAELPHLPELARMLQGGTEGARYPESVAALDPEALRNLGEAYLARARAHRKTDKPFFVDKLPNNWVNTGLIHLILPKATIVDARRNPLDCCFSNFTQNFARGQAFTYSLADLGSHYRHYVDLMRHFDEMLPGRVHRVHHEALVEDSESEIRRLLDHVGVPFEEACLRFYDNKRAVRTPSAAQVRQPINRQGLDKWRPYEPWLDPLKEALGPLVDCYPDLPDRL